MSHRISGFRNVHGEVEYGRPLILGDDESPPRPETTSNGVAEEALEPLEAQGGEKGEAEAHAPHDVARSLPRGLRLLGPSLNEAFSEIHLEQGPCGCYRPCGGNQRS